MKNLRFGLLLIMGLFFVQASALAQTGADQYFDESSDIRHRLWYGGGFNLGFSQQNAFSAFNIGISPMVGYKILDGWSVGPRVSFQYTHISGIGTDSRQHRVPLFSYTASVFTRAKLFSWLFAHFEYEYENSELITVSGSGLLIYDAAQAQVVTVRRVRDNAYVGLGYTQSGGLWGYEVSLLYNVLLADQPPQFRAESPFSIRFGLNYNF